MFAAWIQVVVQRSVFVLLLLTQVSFPMARKFLVQMELGQVIGAFALPHPHVPLPLPTNVGMEHVVSLLQIAQSPVDVLVVCTNVQTELAQRILGKIALALVQLVLLIDL